MNYLKEVIAFNNFSALNSLSPGQFVLWHALMAVNNKCAWKKWFSVSNTVLSAYTRMSVRGINKARSVLKEYGLIDYRLNGKSATEYTINSVVLFDPKTESSNEGSNESSNESYNESSNESSNESYNKSYNKSTTLNKQNKRKQNKTFLYNNTRKNKFNNYEDENAKNTDYDLLEEQILDMMLSEIDNE